MPKMGLKKWPIMTAKIINITCLVIAKRSTKEPCDNKSINNKLCKDNRN